MSMMSIRRVCQKLLMPVIILLVVALTVGMFYIGIPAMTKETTAYKGPSVKINGQHVKDKDFNNYIFRAAQQASQMQQYGATYSESQVRDMALTIAIQETAFAQELKKAKIKVTNADVDNLIKKYLPTEEELQSFMERQGYSNKNEFKKAVRQDVEKQKFIAAKARELKIKIPKEQVVGMLEQIGVSHILVGLKDSSGKEIRTDAQAVARANEVYAKVSEGGDFSELAKQYSDDPGSKDKGGSLGKMPVDQFKNSMVKPFVDGALALKAGQFSKPVKSDFGYHIIKLDSRDMPKGKEYKEKYQETEDDLLMRQAPYDQAFQDWLQNLYKKAQDNMEIQDPGLRAYRLKQEQKWQEAAQAYQKAITRKYYKGKADVYIEASEVYRELKQPKEAIAILKKAPADAQDTIEYQTALAKAYVDAGQKNTAKAELTKFSAAHSETNVHEQLKALFTEFKMTDEAAKEDQLLKELERKEKEAMEKYQQSLNQQQSGTQASPNPSPAAN
jgi:parvulin-like peptidyl-prolyl isomerase